MARPISLEEHLKPSHLLEPEEAIKESRKTAPTPLVDPKSKPVYEFDLDYKTPSGQAFAGHFVNHILKIQERQKAGVLLSRFIGGQPVESIGPDTYEMNAELAHMVYSLSPPGKPGDWEDGGSETRPKWAHDLLSIEDPSVISAIWQEVSAHEACRFRPGKVEGDSQKVV